MKNTNKLIRLVSTIGVSALYLSTISVLDVRAEDQANRGQLSAKDYKFVCEAAKGGNTEVALGQIASQRAAASTVRDFGQRMVRDHQKANEGLTQLAAKKGVTLPDLSTRKEEKTAEHLNGLSGPDFDKTYMKDMVQDHKKDVKEFEKEANKADDPDLKNWVSQTLPTLQEHLRKAEDVESSIGLAKTPTITK